MAERTADPTTARHLGLSWVSMSLAFALHVIDESLNDFLSFWNPLVVALRETFSYLPMPTFTYPVWLGGLIVAVLVCFYLSRYAFQEVAWMRPLSYFMSILMLGNGLFHGIASLYLGLAVPGVYSSPLLIAAAIYLHASVRRSFAGRRQTGSST